MIVGGSCIKALRTGNVSKVSIYAEQKSVLAVGSARLAAVSVGSDLSLTRLSRLLNRQILVAALPGSSTYFLQSAGLPTKWAFTLTMVKFSINIFGVAVAWLLMASGIGRRSLYLYGCIAMNIALWIIGGVGQIGTIASLWAVGGMLLAWSIGYQFTIGTVCYSLITEMPSRRLLIKTVNIGRACYNLSNIILGQYSCILNV